MTRFVVALVWAVALGSGVAQSILGPAALMAAPEDDGHGRYTVDYELEEGWTVSQWLEEDDVDPAHVRSLTFDMFNLPDLRVDLALLSNLEHLEVYVAEDEVARDVKGFEVLFKLPQLRQLRLQRLRLDSFGQMQVPEVILHLTSLRELAIVGYQMGPLFSRIGDFQALERLNVSYGGLSSVPEALARLTTLRELGLKGNAELRALPAWMANLPDLTFLDISGTGITHLPEAPGAFPALRRLILGSIALASVTHLPAWATQRVWDKLDCRNSALQALPTGYHLSHVASVNFNRVPFGSGLKLILTHAAGTPDGARKEGACLDLCGTSFPSLVLAVLVPVTPGSVVVKVCVNKTDPLNGWLSRQDTVRQLNQHGLLVYPRISHPFDSWKIYSIERDAHPLPNPASALDMLVMRMDAQRTMMGRLPVRRAGVIDEAPPGPLPLRKLAARRLVQEGKATVRTREAPPEGAEGLFFPFNALSGVLVPSADIAALKAVMGERSSVAAVEVEEPAVEQKEAEEGDAMPPPRKRIRRNASPTV